MGFPHGQADWHAFAAALTARMQLLQVTVEPDWSYALCTQCGWELEATRAQRGAFRYSVASHTCDAPPEPSPAPLELQDSLF